MNALISFKSWMWGSHPQPAFRDLPPDAIVKIFSHLNFDELERCSLVNKEWQVLTRSEDLWKALYFKTAFGQEQWEIFQKNSSKKPSVIQENDGENHIGRLPEEMILEIFSHLNDPTDLLNCGLVHKEWQIISNDELLWKPNTKITFFGAEEWRKLGVDIEDVPLPKNAYKIAKSFCLSSQNQLSGFRL